MYDNWLTDYDTKSQFKPEKNIRRDEAAKFITNFAQTIFKQQWQENSLCYMFNDIPNKSKLRDYVIQSCELWYMRWKNNKFNPGGYLTNEQAIAIVIRIYDGNLEEPKSDRSRNYYKRAKELNLLDWLNLSQKSKPISRWNFSNLLYKMGTEFLALQETWEDSLGDILSSWFNTMLDGMMDLLWFEINWYEWLNNDFIDKASICLSWTSSMTYIDFDMMWLNFYMKYYREIRGFDDNKCNLYERIDDAKVFFNTWIIQMAIASGTVTQEEVEEQISQMQKSIEETIGKSWICRYTTWSLVDELRKELSWEFMPMPDYNTSLDCIWSLYETDD